MFEVKDATYNLRQVPERADAYLSDLFFILYFLYVAHKANKTIDKVKLQKGIADVFEQLNNKDKADKIKVFNLPLYRYHYGDYNKSIQSEYANKLLKDDLIDEIGNNYKLAPQALRLMKEFDASEASAEKVTVTSIIKNYIDKNVGLGFGRIVWRAHSRKIINNGKQTTVDKLENNEKRAIAYNASPEQANFDEFRKGRKATIFPTQYLLRLNSLLEEAEMAMSPINSTEQDAILSELLGNNETNYIQK